MKLNNDPDINIFGNIEEIVKSYPELKGIHPAAKLFPPPSIEEYKLLANDISKNGLIHPIIYTEESRHLVDGRSRLMACNETGVTPHFKTIDEDCDLYAYSISVNIRRRHLGTGQRAIIGVEIKKIKEKEAKERQLRTYENRANACNGNISTTRNEKTKSRDEAGKVVGVSGKSIDKACEIIEFTPKLVDDVKTGKMTLESAHKKAKKVKRSHPKLSEQQPSKKQVCSIIAYDGEEIEINKPSKPTFNKTNDNVGWAGFTWNPVTGCQHNCKFCYAKAIALNPTFKHLFPLGFKPVFHEYRLVAPKNTKVDGRVFVCSMADLFGEWIPDVWIEKVFDACMEAPDWEYIFLTKWPNRYKMLEKLPNAWFGVSIIKQNDVTRVENQMKSFYTTGIKWISLEPMLEPIKFNDLSWCDLVVIGSQTAANGEPAFAPDFDWIIDVVNQCRKAGVKYYLKPNLMELAPGMKLPRDLPSVKKSKTYPMNSNPNPIKHNKSLSLPNKNETTKQRNFENLLSKLMQNTS